MIHTKKEHMFLEKIINIIFIVAIDLLFLMYLKVKQQNVEVFLVASSIVVVVSIISVLFFTQIKALYLTCVSILVLTGYTLHAILYTQGFDVPNLFMSCFILVGSIVVSAIGTKTTDIIIKKSVSPRFTTSVLFALFSLNVLILLALLIAGKTVAGTDSKIQLSIASLSIQPLEFIKVIFVFIYSLLFTKYRLSDKNKIIATIILLATNIIPIIFLGETGTIFVLLVISGIYLFVFIENKKCLVAVFLSCLIFVTVAFSSICFIANTENSSGNESNMATSQLVNQNGNMGIFSPIKNRIKIIYKRITSFIDLDNAGEEGRQLRQGRDAVIVGGLWGAGKYKASIINPQSDFAFIALLQNCGIVFGILALVMYLIILLVGFFIANKEISRLYSALVIGCVSTIFVETMIMVLGSTGLLFMTGVPMAFISQGGVNAMTVFFMSAVVLYHDKDAKDVNTEAPVERKV